MFIITGGGSGIGKSLAELLAKRDQSVLIVGRRKEPLVETAANSPIIDYLVADIATEKGINTLVQRVQHEPHIAALINNAGTVLPILPLGDVSMSAWHHTLKTNLDAALFLPQRLHKQLINRRVLNIGSGAAYFPIKGWGAYCVSKAALSMLTRCWQLEAHDIAFASVMPGIADTDMQLLARESLHMDDEQVDFYRTLKQSNRLVAPETVAEFLAWLLLEVDTQTYKSKEWDIYDTSHHYEWLKEPHRVIHWES